jgi:hypothetical protein
MSNSLVPYNGGMVPYNRQPVSLLEGLGGFGFPSFSPAIPESPETAIARGDPYRAARLLREISKDRLTERALDTAAIISHDYLSYLPKERLANSNGVRVSFQRTRSFFFGENGFSLDIDLK